MQALKKILRKIRDWFVWTDDQDYSVFDGFKDAPKPGEKVEEEKEESEFYYCPNDSTLLHEHWENNGFDPPEGAPHYEVSHWYCPVCDFKTEDPEKDAIPDNQ